jgi:starch-binding outer membrane protein, SusD/RagB family
LYGLALSLGISACDVIDIDPVSVYTDDNFWAVRPHAEAGVIAIYDAMQDLGDDFIAWGEARGDLVQPGWGHCCNHGIDIGAMQLNQINDANRYSNWADVYTVINRANIAIAKIPDVVAADFELNEANGNFLIGEARFLRALSYFWLAKVFKDAPLVTSFTTPDSDLMVRRTSQEKLLDFVQAELDTLIGVAVNPAKPNAVYLRTEFGSDIRLNSGRATLGAARSLLAQLALWRNDYETVVEQTTAVISSNRYRLEPGSNWFNNFYPGLSSEIIFQIIYEAQQNDRNNMAYDAFRNVMLTPSTYIRDLHESPGNLDYRDNVRGNGRTWIMQNAYYYKFIGRSPANVPADRVSRRDSERGNDRDPNMIFFRLADIYLMRAEALNRLDRKEEAIADINVVRTRAALPPAIVITTRNQAEPTVLTAASSQIEIEDAILEERAMELAAEGHRWFDLMRISLRRGTPDLLVDYINVESKYSYGAPGAWDAFVTNPGALRVANLPEPDENTWYMPVFRQNTITNPNLLDPPL